MGDRDRGAIVQGLERLLGRGVDPSRDGDLLARFRAEGDQAAFEALVTRHGPMVRGVCRRLLRDDHDADDAFQATFLVLARKGAGLRDPDRLGPWLYGVASRVAARARSRSARRRGRPLTDDVPAREDDRGEWSDVLPILDAELARLPSSQRDVLVACLLQGSSEQEAARAFACPVGTIKSRLSRAKEALRLRLVRRGIAPATALAAASSPGSAASPVSAPLLRATLSLVAAPAAVPRSVAALTSGVAPIMFTRILAPAAAIAGGLTIVGLSAVAWTADPPPEHPATAQAVRAPSPSQTRRQLDLNLKSIALAVHNYAAAHDSLPPAASRSRDGRPLLSWRVALLPYLDEQALYDRFHLDEPWDGPHNRQLVDLMPAVFEAPGFPAPRGQTRIRGVGAPGAAFGPPPERGRADLQGGAEGPGMMGMMAGEAPGGAGGGPPPPQAPPPVAPGRGPDRVDEGVRFVDVTDGTSNTALVVLAEDAVEWTRPGELDVPGGLVYGATMPAIVADDDGYILAMVDGSVRRLPRLPRGRESLLSVLSIAGGEVLSSDLFAAPPPPPPAPAEPKAGPQAPAAFERRLRRVEEKLDEILERLDAMAPAAEGP